MADHNKDIIALEWLINRIDRFLLKNRKYGILFFDSGNEVAHTRLVRKMMVFNPVPSKRGQWDDTKTTYKNIPITRNIEDPLFKNSEHSYFIQAVDCCAYALLRRENPIASKSKYNIDQAFAALSKITVKEANPQDPDGIVRIK